ncbi:hypothetical protein [Cereibacter sediminicola]|uniref:hypothetical protein n=1 Tax=Cereibacter sediminicola TaxID=2584941 RepID=UPI0011AA3E11|nr:hypothetical protein [Cereibacter sediminicola]
MIRILAVLLGLAALPVLAHEPSPGPHGGLKVDAGAWHAELVADGSPTVTVYLFDASDAPVSVEGWKGQATLVIGGAPQRFPLAPAGEVLQGQAAAPVPAGSGGAVRLTSPDGTTATATF